MRTVTYDETQFAIVPIEPTQSMLDETAVDVGMPDYDGSKYSSTDYECKEIWAYMIQAAPPYPESNCKEILDSSAAPKEPEQ